MKMDCIIPEASARQLNELMQCSNKKEKSDMSKSLPLAWCFEHLNRNSAYIVMARYTTLLYPHSNDVYYSSTPSSSLIPNAQAVHIFTHFPKESHGG